MSRGWCEKGCGATCTAGFRLFALWTAPFLRVAGGDTAFSTVGVDGEVLTGAGGGAGSGLGFAEAVDPAAAAKEAR